jgi:glycosyltransferase involved in cell wall biosynthesis
MGSPSLLRRCTSRINGWVVGDITVRIGFFTDSYLPALHGVEVSIEAFRKSLQKAGHEVFVYAPAVPHYRDTNRRVFRLKSVRVIEKPEMRLAFPVVEHGHLRDLLRVRLDIVHAHTPFTMGLLAKHVSVRQGIPLIYTHHTHYPEYAKAYLRERLVFPYLAQALSAWFSNTSDAVLAPSPKIKRLLRTYGVTKPIHVLPTGIKLTQFRKTRASQDRARALRRRLDIDDSARVLLFVGRMGREKNVEFLIRAFSELRAQRADVAFILVGDGPILPQLKSLAKELRLAEIVFAGAIPHTEIAAWYQMSDLFLFASLTDTQGIVILEALASGLGVIALRDTAFTDIVINGKNGLLTAPNASPRVFAARVDMALSNPALRRGFARNALETARRFAEHEQAKKLIRIYERLVVLPKCSRQLAKNSHRSGTGRNMS